jgi:two-component system response regulator BaeR
MTAESPARSVFVVEDDAKISALLSDYLSHTGHIPRVFPDGRGVIDAVRNTPPAAILLDLMLPVIDGLTLCRALREFSTVPILMITARVDEIHRLKGLDTGADDYICKPFSAREVMARVNALIRRAEGRLTTDLAAGKSHAVDPDAQRVAWRGTWLDLSPSEFRLLATLMGQPGRIFSRDQLLDQLGDRSLDSSDRAIDSHVKNIRRKIATVDPQTACIASIYGVGYRFDKDA